MSATVQDRINLHEKRGMLPLSVHFIEVKSGLPAAVWRSLSIAERPGGDAFSEVIKPVIVNDNGTRVVVLTAGHYDALIDRLGEFERWLEECLSEEAAS